MAQEFFRTSSVTLDNATYDAGLRRHMQSVFNYMGAGLAVTGLTAYVASHFAAALYGTAFVYLIMFAPLAFLLFFNFKAGSMSLGAMKTAFWAFCGVMGLSLGMIFLVFTQESVARAFFITAATFGATSLWGYTTKRNLYSMGAFMMMGLIGVIIAGIVNIFLMSSMIQWVVSVASVAIFTGLTAYQVQAIKQNYSSGFGEEANDKMAVFGALSLYLNFINMFQAILQLTGTIRRS